MKRRSFWITEAALPPIMILSILVALSVPALYFGVSNLYMTGGINAEMAFLADAVEGLIAKNPKTWQFEEIRILGILERRLDPESHDSRTVRDLQGKVVAEIREPLARPTMAFHRLLYDSGTDVARLEVERSIAPLVVQTALIGAFSVLLGILLALLYHFLPLRSVREAQERLRVNEERLRSFISTSQEWIWAIDTAGIHTYSNPAVHNILGYDPEEIVGRSILDSLIHEEDLPRVKDLLDQGIRLKQGWPQAVIRWKHKDGTWRWLESCAVPVLDGSGDLQGFQGADRDITERRKAEEEIRRSEGRYRTIFENTATANVLIAEDSTILMANGNFAALCGYSKEELEGKMSWTAFIHKEDLERMMEYHRMRRRDPASTPPSYEFRSVNRKGDVLDLFLSAAVIPGTKTSIISMIDLTKSKRLEAMLLQAQKMESVGRLAGGVAHDFNNMLGVIMGNAELAMEMVDPSQPLHATLGEIYHAGGRSADLTRQLLAFARRQTIAPRVLDLNDTVSGMLQMLRRLIGEDVELGWNPGTGLWKVKIDPSQVDQLLANLAVNARDAIEKTGRIAIGTSNEHCDAAYFAGRPECIPGEYVMLAVSDDGCGMGKDILENIFEPFFTTKKEGQGTGLGLATVYGIVKQNQGFINVYSEPGMGTTFRIYLPRHQAGIPQAAEDRAKGKAQGGTETILIAEDEEAVLHLAQSMLERLGYRVLAARKAEEAIRLAGEHGDGIDLLLTDVVMPDLDGKALLERIHSVKPGLKCLFMSGYTADVISRQGILDEGVRFLTKPFSLQALAAKVREALGS